MIKHCWSLLLIFLINAHTFAQDFTWWNEIHDWDGSTHWSQYMNQSAAYMGPNAIPVPEVKNGNIRPNKHFQLAIDAHFSKGDKTQNLFTKLSLPLYEDKVAFEISWVPYEIFKTDTVTRNLRASRGESGEGSSVGDLYFHTHFQLVEDHKKLPDLLFSLNFKTTSGSNLKEARYTDTHGFWVDLSAGKTIETKKAFKAIRPYAMAGFFVYQTLILDEFQNDSPLMGAGLEIHFAKNITLNNCIGGYYGHYNHGDRPFVFRSSVRTSNNAPINTNIQFQQGIHDYPYSSIRLGLDLSLNKESWNQEKKQELFN